MSWPKVKLGALCDTKSGGTPRRGNSDYYSGEIPWVKIGDLDAQNGVILDTDEKITEAGLASIGNRIFEKGTILLSMYGSVGKVAIAGRKLAINQAILGLTIKDEKLLNPRYFVHWLRTIQKELTHSARGGTLQNINQKMVRDVDVPLPPIEEQIRISAILDKADEIKKGTKRAVETRAKVLHSLFHEMFGDLVSIDKGWGKCALGTHIKIKHGYAFKSQFFTNEGDFVLLTPGNFWEEGGYKDRGEKQPYYVGEIPADYILSKNDLLVAMTEQAPGLLGSAIIISEDNRFLHNQRLGLVTYDENNLDLHFLYFLFNSPRIRDLIQIRSTGTKVKHTSPTKMEEIEVFLPPIELQKEFSKYCRLENNNSDYDIVRVEELVNSITQEMIA